MEWQSVPGWEAISGAVIAIAWLTVMVWSLITIHGGSARVHRTPGGSGERRFSLWSTPTPRWVLIVTAVVVALSLTGFALSLIGIYVGDELMHPSVNEHSVPPARLY